MESNKIVNWGIIGAGKIAAKFAKDLDKVPGATLYAIASRDVARAAEFANEHGAKKNYGNYQSLVKDENVDVIYIASPHSFHKEHTLLALNHGKHVLCEKPFAMNESEVVEMVDVARQKQLFLMEAMWTAFLPHFLKVKEIIESQELGKVISLEADFGFKAIHNPDHRLWKKSLGGGSLLDIGIYPVFAALSIIGYPNEIKAFARKNKDGVDEETKVLFSYESGETAVLRSSLVATTPTELILYCDNGTIKISGKFHEPSAVTVYYPDREVILEDFGYDSIGYYYEALHVTNCIMQNKTESEVMPLSKSLVLIKLLDQIRDEINLVY